MARCDEGYICEVCGKPVDEMFESDLYLSYILGEVRVEDLNRLPERHIRCNPAQAQFINDPEFKPVVASGVFSKHALDADFVREREQAVTAAWRRLQEVSGSSLPIDEYPLTSTK